MLNRSNSAFAVSEEYFTVIRCSSDFSSLKLLMALKTNVFVLARSVKKISQALSRSVCEKWFEGRFSSLTSGD